MLPSLISLSQSLHDGNPYEVEPPNPPLGPRFPKIKSEDDRSYLKLIFEGLILS